MKHENVFVATAVVFLLAVSVISSSSAFLVDNKAVSATALDVCSFPRSLYTGISAPEVKCLQKYLNASGFAVSQTGAGSSGAETEYFGLRTKQAVAGWQVANGLPSTGYFGPMSRAKYAEISIASLIVTKTPPVTEPVGSEPINADPSCASCVTPVRQIPVIEKVYPAEIRPGDSITIQGKNFTLTGNTVILRFGLLDQKIENIPSPDGKTLTVTFEAPEMKPISNVALAAVPASVLKELTDQLNAKGVSIDVLNQPYRNLGSEAELDTFLRTQGRSIKDLYDPYLVIVKNPNGQSVDSAPHFRGLRDLKFSN